MARSGSCHCGSVKFSFEGEPIRSLLCFCKDCQKMSGSDRFVALWVPNSKFTIHEGELDQINRIADSGNEVENYYCSKCHTRVYGLGKAADVAVIPVSLLHDQSGLEPSMAIYTSSAMPWSHIPEGVKSFEGMPVRK